MSHYNWSQQPQPFKPDPNFVAPSDFRGFGLDGEWYDGNGRGYGILGGNPKTDYPNYLKRKAKEAANTPAAAATTTPNNSVLANNRHNSSDSSQPNFTALTEGINKMKGLFSKSDNDYSYGSQQSENTDTFSGKYW